MSGLPPDVISGSPISDGFSPTSTTPSPDNGDGSSGGGGKTSYGAGDGDPGFPLPLPPSRIMRSVAFNAAADAFMLALGALPAYINTPANAAALNARNANAAAKASTSTVGAFAWSDTKYYLKNDLAISLLDYQTYRRKDDGPTTVDPRLDPANWMYVNKLPMASAIMMI
jgi:hypothetical protein